jgi:dTDP-4-dehydrorhamnose 3,5-epimerase
LLYVTLPCLNYIVWTIFIATLVIVLNLSNLVQIILSNQLEITYNADNVVTVEFRNITQVLFVPSRITILQTEMPGVLEIHPQVFEDGRGYFTETYSQSIWAEQGFQENFVQDNLSLSNKGVLRGLHYQLLPHGMGKMIRVLSGAIFDVIVDLRKGSPAFGRWMGRTLKEDVPVWLWVPVGFAQGFLALADNTRVYYKCTGCHHDAAERGLRYNDPDIGIQWPAPVETVSTRDISAPLFADCEYNFEYKG